MVIIRSSQFSFSLSSFLPCCLSFRFPVFLPFGCQQTNIHAFTARSAAPGWLGGPPPLASESTGNAFHNLGWPHRQSPSFLPVGPSVLRLVAVVGVGGVLVCILEVPTPDQEGRMESIGYRNLDQAGSAFPSRHNQWCHDTCPTLWRWSVEE